ncbi:MAG: glycosyltransferase family 4 protein [bacterium]|nr:MAG: glycosyltransferase family 4 protein [bacterium]
MDVKRDLKKIAFVGNYIPRQCGIATFTYDLRSAVSSLLTNAECIVVPVNDRELSYHYPAEVRFEMAESDLASYQRAADFLNFSNIDVVSLQHEYGIYGGKAGSHILALLRSLRMPVVTTLHTILREPNADQRRVMKEIVTLSARLVVMSERGKQFLTEIYQAAEQKIDLIAHGIPDMPFVDPNFYKDQFGVEGKHVVLTFGLLSPNKGIENVLKALPAVITEFPNLVYIVLGATHPNELKYQGEAYRMGLERLAHDLGIKKHVIFYNRYVELDELKEFIGAADIYITPYLNPAQITSGTLSYAFGCGKLVISTPYWYAEELLADNRGILVPFNDANAISTALFKSIRDESLHHSMRKKAYLLGREMVWSNIAHRYIESLQKARLIRVTASTRAFAVKTLEEQQQQLPALQLDHLFRLSDSTGILQHAQLSIPNFIEGYCTDDNARALQLMVLLEELGIESRRIQQLTTSYAAFLNYAYNVLEKRFRNFMGFDRHWAEQAGSDDCQGRAIWALGMCVGRSKHQNLQTWGVQLFDQALPTISELSSPRAWAFALLGIHEYFRRLSGDRAVNQLRDTLTERLIELYQKTADDDWPWFEDVLSYSNARLSHALLVSGRWMNHQPAFDIGIKSLHWLTEIQTSEAGYFHPIGSNGFHPRNGRRAEFDQQPIEAHAMVSACLEAYRITAENFWLDQARTAFEWFLGRNDLGLPLYDPNTGGCYDGLHVDRINQNQGAESTLAFLLSLVEMKLIETSLSK